jgi:pSer/pThr/pTyr-binding forkhead associated (FHA) protein
MAYLKIFFPTGQEGADKGIIKQIPLKSGGKFIIGRAPNNNLVLSNDNRCSRHHSEIFKKEEWYFIRDLKSRNGTIVNGNKIQPTGEGEGEKLVSGSIINIGNSSFEFVLDEDSAVKEDEIAPVGQVTSEKEVRFIGPSPTGQADERVLTETVEIKLDEEEEAKHQADFIGKKVTSKYLSNVYEIARIISSERTIGSLLDKVLKFIVGPVKLDAGYIILVEKNRDKITFLGRHPKDQSARMPRISKTIIKRVIQYTRPILTADPETLGTTDVSSVICVPLIKMANYDGILYLETTDKEKQFSQEDLEITSTIAIQTGLAMISISASDRARKMLMSMVKMLVSIVEMQDLSMQGHSERVANYALAISMHLGMSIPQLHQVQLSALLHDIGKIISTSTAKEEHIYSAEKLLSQIPDLGEVLPAIKYHHERLDGTGFPYQIKDKNVPLLARIVSVANVLDNLIISSGKKGTGLPVSEAISEIEQQSGKGFDPAVVNALITSHNDGSLFKSAKPFEQGL